MRFQTAFILSLGFLGLVSGQGNSPTYNFEMFLEDSLKNYSTWLRTNNLDPTTPITTDTLLLNATGFVLKIECTIREDQLVGHANLANNQTVVAEVDIDHQFFSVGIQNQGLIKFQGKYTTNGTSMNTEFSGSGTWNYTASDGLYETATYRFGVDDKGFVEISEDRREYNVTTLGQKQVKFEGELDEKLEGYELERVENLFATEYENMKIKQINPDHLTASLLHRYLTDVFKKTEYTDIIGVVKPIPTEPSSTTNTPAPPTSSTLSPQDNLACSLHSTGYMFSIFCATFLIVTSMTNGIN